MPTISDVAKLAGVSPATVSRVMRGASNVRPATRKIVEQAIEELGYVPSAVAQSLRSKRTRSLALVVSDITNTFWTTVARGVEDVAQQHDYSILLCNTDENLAKQLRYLGLLISQQVDGVIIAPYDSDSRHLSKLRQRNIPTVLIDRRIEGWDVDTVRSDSISGARALVQHLIGLGHRRIAVVSGPACTSTAEDRVTGYLMALSEASIPVDSRLILRGEFHAANGEELMARLMNEGVDFSAVFATNNAIAMGVMAAVEKRGLQIPDDVALVCYDDVPIVSRIFPFLTAVDQPAYDIGLNAAQLLLSRLNSEVELQPRHVLLPTRLIIRHSCGSTLGEGAGQCMSVPLPQGQTIGSTLIKPVTGEESDAASVYTEVRLAASRRRQGTSSDHDKSDVKRLLRALQHQEADRLPYLELEVTSRGVLEYVLEHELGETASRARSTGVVVSPEDHVEFAQRLGMDAVPCPFLLAPGADARSPGQGSRFQSLAPELSLTDQLSRLERYLRAAQGTGVGVIASFSSFFGPAVMASGESDPRQAEELMDVLLRQQQRAMRVVCDRFADDLALVVVHDYIADGEGLRLPREWFATNYAPRMKRLLESAKEHDKPVGLRAAGRLEEALPILHEIGFDLLHPGAIDHNELLQLKQQWRGLLVLMGGMPAAVLAKGQREEIEARVRDCCVQLAPGGGYVLSSSQGITNSVPPESVVIMVQAARRYGRYGRLGVDA